MYIYIYIYTYTYTYTYTHTNTHVHTQMTIVPAYDDPVPLDGFRDAREIIVERTLTKTSSSYRILDEDKIVRYCAL